MLFVQSHVPAHAQLGWVLAVSYTHLDVYKRQVKGGEAVKSGLPGYLGNGLVRLPQQAAGLGYPKRSQAAVEYPCIHLAR